MSSRYDVYITERAEQDLDEILLYIATELCNPQAARDLGARIFESIENVRDFPERGSLLDNEFMGDKPFRKLIVDNYIVIYLVKPEESKVYIVRVFYGARNINDILLEI